MKCPICGGDMGSVIITQMGGIDNVKVPAHLCPGPITANVNVTMTAEEFNEQLKKVRNWHVTYSTRKPVPQAFQDAFRDGELEV